MVSVVVTVKPVSGKGNGGTAHGCPGRRIACNDCGSCRFASANLGRSAPARLNRPRGIDYILAVTEQGIAKAVGTAGPQAVVQMIRMCCSSCRFMPRLHKSHHLSAQRAAKQIS